MGLAYKLDGVNWDEFICPNSPKTTGKSLLSVLFFSENSVLFKMCTSTFMRPGLTPDDFNVSSIKTAS